MKKHAISTQSKIKERPLVYCRFWDHATDSADQVRPIIIEMFGILKESTDLCYIIVPWIADYNLNDNNSDGYCIIKSTVVEYKELNIRNGGRNEHKTEKRYKRSSRNST